jgi:putative intracellular protease/amidase
LTDRGHSVTFATPEGRAGKGDDVMLTGIGLDPWGCIPGIRQFKLVGLLLRANKDARHAYRAMIAASEFRNPARWDALNERDFDGLLLPGGHRARGMREYLESEVLKRLVARFFDADKPVAAICHGVLLAARSERPDGRSVLHGRKTTGLPWAFESRAAAIARASRWWDPFYYRTYTDPPGFDPGYMSVQEETRRALASVDDFLNVPRGVLDFKKKTGGLARDSLTDESPSWVVRDGGYLSARWPGDAHAFARQFCDMLDAG